MPLLLDAKQIKNSVQVVSSISTLRSLSVSDTRNIRVNAYYSTQSGGGGLFSGKTGASVGTYIDNGSTIIVPTGGNGSSAWIRIVEDALDIRACGAYGDGTTDDTAAVVTWLTQCAALRCVGYGSQGTYMITRIDQTLGTDVNFQCHSDCIFKGTVSSQSFNGNGSTTSFTITAFTFYALGQGINLEIINTSTNASVAFLTEGTHYTRSGAVLNLAGGSSPYGAVASGHRLNVTSTNPVITLRNVTSSRIDWMGGTFDASLRGTALALASGTGLLLIGWKAGSVTRTAFYGATDYEAARANRISDSGLVLTETENFDVLGNYFQGWGDMGVYATGGSDNSSSADNGGNLRISGNIFKRCEGGVKAVRQLERFIVVNNFFIELAASAIINGITGTPGLDSGSDYLINGNIFKKIGRRAIDLRAMARGATITANRFEDVGFMLDGTTPYKNQDGSTESAPICILLTGCASTVVADNWFGFREWGANNQRAIQVSPSVFQDNSTAYADNVTIYNNYIQGFVTGIVESGTASNIRRCRYNDNIMVGVTTPMTITSSTTVYDYINGADNVKWQGVGTATAWRAIPNGFAPGTSVTPSANGDLVFQFSNNTTLTIKGKGTDGVVRSANITLS